MFSVLASFSSLTKKKMLLVGTTVNKFHQFKDSCNVSQRREANLIQAPCWGIAHHCSATSDVVSPCTVWVAVATVVLALFNASIHVGC